MTELALTVAAVGRKVRERNGDSRVTETIRTAIAAASAYLLEHRDEARYTDKSVR